MYCNIASHYKGEKRVVVQAHRGQHSYLDVLGYTMRFMHGHQVRYGGGVGGIHIPLNKALAQWDKIERADYTVAGHFHQLVSGANYVMNGSLCGYNSFALSIKASYERPQQALFLIDKKYGRTVLAPVFV